ncbi:hypothetical protein [Streptococcus phocae]|uniref:Uncharacterized protein n=1 Tax=Streptococcus phocae TaxID=119224 RepID=A0A0P6SCM4_9STRE|nr:hypothetical protein [Streptococcus phocae]KPJ21724.1 hypothetical protein AKK44_08385 [Streptococcus phocae]
MVVFKDASYVEGAYKLLENGDYGDHAYFDDFEVGTVYLPGDSISDYFGFRAFRALLYTRDGLKEFTTTRDRIYTDARTYRSPSAPPPRPDTPQGNSWNFKSIVINGKNIARVVSNNRVIWISEQKPEKTKKLIFNDMLTGDDVFLSAYPTYYFVVNGETVVKKAEQITTGYMSIGGVYFFTQISSQRELVISSFNPVYVQIYGES